MAADPHDKAPRQFQIRNYLWDAFEQMSQEYDCTPDSLVNEAMRQFAHARNRGGPYAEQPEQMEPLQAQRGGFPGRPGMPGMGQPQPQQGMGGGLPRMGSGPQQPPGLGQPPGMARPGGLPGMGQPPGLGQPPGMPGARPGGLPSMSPGMGQPPGLGQPPGMARPGGGSMPGMGQPPGLGQPPGMARPGGTQMPGMPGGMPGAPPQQQRPGGMPGAPPQMGQPPRPPARPGNANRTLIAIFEGQQYPVTKEEFVIGRGQKTSDLTIRDSNVSRRHACIVLYNGQYWIVDQQSTNGVEFNGTKVERKVIEDGDMVRICDHEIQFVYR